MEAPNHQEAVKQKTKEIMALFQAGSYQAALPLALEVMQARQEEWGPAHSETLEAKQNYATILIKLKRY